MQKLENRRNRLNWLGFVSAVMNLETWSVGIFFQNGLAAIDLAGIEERHKAGD